jgi:hypothetical protein
LLLERFTRERSLAEDCSLPHQSSAILLTVRAHGKRKL